MTGAGSKQQNDTASRVARQELADGNAVILYRDLYAKGQRLRVHKLGASVGLTIYTPGGKAVHINIEAGSDQLVIREEHGAP